MKAVFSLCLPVYNQLELLKANLDCLLEYRGDDIRIVVSDNCSEEDIAGLVKSYNDKRIKYCRTSENIGHDGNIINAFRNCDTRYAFLLRTRDFLLPDKIPKIIESINKYPCAAYMRFSAIDDEGKLRVQLDDRLIRGAEDVLKADGELLIHPSGELYDLSRLNASDYDEILHLLRAEFPDNNAFLTHILLRHLLASRGCFATVSEAVWYYAYTYKAKDKAVVNNGDSRPKGYSPYSPRYQYPRLKAEIEYISDCVPKVLRKEMIRYIIRRYAEMITVSFKELNENEGFLAHYNCVKEDFSPRKEKLRFLRSARKGFSACRGQTRLYVILVSYYYLLLRFPLRGLKSRLRKIISKGE